MCLQVGSQYYVAVAAAAGCCPHGAWRLDAAVKHLGLVLSIGGHLESAGWRLWGVAVAVAVAAAVKEHWPGEAGCAFQSGAGWPEHSTLVAAAAAAAAAVVAAAAAVDVVVAAVAAAETDK